MNYFKIIVRDSFGIAATCGWLVAFRWVACVVATFPECLKTRNLQPADRRMGRGPFVVTRRGASATLTGEQVFSGIREIWVRDVYLKNDYLTIPPGALVIDLGANIGNFTNLALAQHPDVRVIAVEPSLKLSKGMAASLQMNSWSERAVIKRAFIGVATQVQVRVGTDPDYSEAKYVSEADFLEEFNVKRIDFLKCDIEGSEFFMLSPRSNLLSITESLAIELHAAGGSISDFLDRIRLHGFEVGSVVGDLSGDCIALCKRTRVQAPTARMVSQASEDWNDQSAAGHTIQ